MSEEPRETIVMGGANTAQQCFNAGLLDELHIHVAYMLLGEGTRLFDKLTIQPTDLEETAVINKPAVTHFKFRIQ